MTVFKFPLARISLVFIAGIAAQQYLKFSTALIIAILCGCWLVMAALLMVRKTAARMVFGAIAQLVFFILGAFCVSAHTDLNKHGHFTKILAPTNEQHALSLIVREKLKTTAAYQRYICDLNAVDGKPCTGKIALNLPQKLTPKLFTGHRITLAGRLATFKKPLNPEQFDYGKYLSNKNVFAQVYADAFVITGIHKSPTFYADALRRRIANHLEKSGFEKTELQVFNALLLGQQQEIDAEIVRDYQFAGAVHILSVSGLHVGFVLLMLNATFAFTPKTRFWRWLKLLVVITGLWSFALLAGLSPSVVRSALMFSILAVGMHVRRGTNIFHTLLVSMLIILAFRPGFLFDVGFQLSYLALFFIVWMQPVFDNFWRPDNRAVRYIWNILCVSFSAQLGTLPLSLYYFHQFPGLFFITNLIVLPMLSAIMAAGLICAIWAAFAQVPFPMIWITQTGIRLLNTIVEGIAGCEQFIFTDIPFNAPYLVVSYVVAAAFIVWLRKPCFKPLAIALLGLSLLQMAMIWEKRELCGSEWIVFHSRKETLIASRQNRHLTVQTQNDLSARSLEYTLQPFMTARSVADPDFEKLPSVSYFAGKRIYILDSAAVVSDDIQADLVLLTQSPRINLDRLLKNTKPEVIVADGSNFRSYVKRWELTCRKQKIPFHATAEKGYYRLTENR